ncbi:M24 family metallopeptidase [Rubrivirga sp.]|uniref:M24 family metallopeptidase n=1 Tax=Rubrivirga sp. TaxID=1885344 RepID=UPI003C792C84
MTPLGQIRRLIRESNCDFALLSDPAELRWAVGFTGSNGLLLVGRDQSHFFTDSRYTVQAASEVTTARVHLAESSLVSSLSDLAVLEERCSVVFSSDKLTVAQYRSYQKKLTQAEFVPIDSFLSEAIAQKTDAQVEAVRRAQALTCEVFEGLVSQIKPGVTERDIGAEIVYQHLSRGASAMSFEPIVAGGARGAKPHARPSSHALEKGDMVVIDMGCVLDGYCSDMTRTVSLGEPSGEARRAYDAVRAAQIAAIEVAAAGLTGSDLDSVARSVLEDAGFGDAFSHSLGHGVGLEVHEWPRLSSKVDHVLPPNATVTIEPGVYIEGEFGIRIEDLIVLREGGNDNLTPLSTELIVL